MICPSSYVMIAFLAESYLSCKVLISASPESSQPPDLSQEPCLADHIYAEVEQGKCTVIELEPGPATPPAAEPEHSISKPEKDRKQKVSIAETASCLLQSCRLHPFLIKW